MSENGNVREDIKTQMDSIIEISKQLEIAIKIMMRYPDKHNEIEKPKINEILAILIENNIENLVYLTWSDTQEGYNYWFELSIELRKLFNKIKEAL